MSSRTWLAEDFNRDLETNYLNKYDDLKIRSKWVGITYKQK
jgi:hypothetical protein